MFNQINEKDLLKLIFDKYGTLSLNRKQSALTVGVSIATLDRMANKGVGPSYKKVETTSKSNNGAVRYPLHELVKYIVNGNIQCA